MKSEIRKLFDKQDKSSKAEWNIILLENLPDDCPVLAVQEFAAKSLAEFHLVKLCLVPKGSEILKTNDQ